MSSWSEFGVSDCVRRTNCILKWWFAYQCRHCCRRLAQFTTLCNLNFNANLLGSKVYRIDWRDVRNIPTKRPTDRPTERSTKLTNSILCSTVELVARRQNLIAIIFVRITHTHTHILYIHFVESFISKYNSRYCLISPHFIIDVNRFDTVKSHCDIESLLIINNESFTTHENKRDNNNHKHVRTRIHAHTYAQLASTHAHTRANEFQSKRLKWKFRCEIHVFNFNEIRDANTQDRTTEECFVRQKKKTRKWNIDWLARISHSQNVIIRRLELYWGLLGLLNHFIES